ncbi:hypothetical protein NPIL_308691 [Nephila pilipes]|uniref:Uncharacterized protein n=1 Tax=Nephila pilipes TaxID=299642 RepID=A0A8X6UXT4_NEPPI|nr:hypothetical protein NPIL_308691 [Nephila pilipes]
MKSLSLSSTTKPLMTTRKSLETMNVLKKSSHVRKLFTALRLQIRQQEITNAVPMMLAKRFGDLEGSGVMGRVLVLKQKKMLDFFRKL